VVAKSDPLPPAVHALMELAHAPEMVTAIRRILRAHVGYVAKRAKS
jgi:hypothetical protein